MNFDYLAFLALGFAAIPFGLFFLNLFVYRPLPAFRNKEENNHSANAPFTTERELSFLGKCFDPQSSNIGSIQTQTNSSVDVSILIPARNEERNIQATLEAALASRACNFEIVVLDDHSTDATSSIVYEFAARDKRVRLELAPKLPAGWCGKQHACHVLARHARGAYLVFLDADVRLAPDAVARMLSFIKTRGPALASGVPRQVQGSFGERLLIPLIHFVLLGFLPMFAMRRTKWASMSAGCGQLFIASSEAYHKCGGHSKLRESLHDGIKLPRAFRQAGFATDLFDATDLATCRMYSSGRATWSGLSKNATEGLAAPGTILPMTALLFGGQVMPVFVLGAASFLSNLGFGCAILGVVLGLTPRMIGVWKFHQPIGSALLHPFGVLALLAIQWQALFRHFQGKPSTWKGRTYLSAETINTV